MRRGALLLKHYLGTPDPPKRIVYPSNVCIDDGYYIDPDNGKILGHCVELDNNNNNHFLPLYTYNRSWRFTSLFTEFQIALCDQHRLLRMFEKLEKRWEAVKSSYDRVYFLTQKLLLQSLCQRLDIKSTQPATRPISDPRRYRRQMKIFDDLWCAVGESV